MPAPEDGLEVANMNGGNCSGSCKRAQPKSEHGEKREYRSMSCSLDTLENKIADHISTIAGLKEALTWENRVLKSVWAILVMAGVTATVWLIYQSVVEFFDEATATKVRTPFFECDTGKVPENSGFCL